MAARLLTELERLGAPFVFCALEIGDYVDALYPEERALLARAVTKRRFEFSSGRMCARRALVTLGLAPAPILCGPMREPLWPPGVVGSITHHGGYAVAAVQLRSRLTGIGVDIAECEDLPAELVEQVCTPRDRDAVKRLATTFPSVDPALALFSIKEAAYKCVYPATMRTVDLADITVRWAPSGPVTQLAVETSDEIASGLRGACCCVGSYFFSAIWMEAKPCGSEQRPSVGTLEQPISPFR